MITIVLVHERDTQRHSVYSGDMSGLIGNQYLGTLALRQRFGGRVPERLLVTIEDADDE